MILGYLEREKCKDDRLYALQFASDIDVDMTSLIQAGKTKQGRSAIIDNQHFSYVSNGPGSQKLYNWCCSNRKCDAILGTRKSTGNLVGDTLPSHQLGNQLKRTAKKTESAQF